MFRTLILSLMLWAASALAAAQGSPAPRQVTDLAGNVVTIPREINRIACMDVLCYSADASKFIINDIRGAERHLKLFCRKIIIDTLQVF
ncbi:hypothetical protein [Desulfobacter curvatus]|uniref:hypothetical protein n=1 Tax=Desulfobacter curvatus TaxID=2290 RepID=UPI000371AA85|nr:hypothetical protein [Desulfobacter curvatus]